MIQRVINDQVWCLQLTTVLDWTLEEGVNSLIGASYGRLYLWSCLTIKQMGTIPYMYIIF